MTLREVVANEVGDLLKKHPAKDVSEMTGLNSIEIQNIMRNETPNLRYFTIISVALKLGIKIEYNLVDERVYIEEIVSQ